MSLRAAVVVAVLVGGLVAPAGAGAIALTPIATHDYLFQVAPGRDGAVWVAGYEGLLLKEPNGLLRSPAPGDNIDVDTPIAGAPDGSVWFLSRNHAAVGNLTPGGALRWIPLPQSLTSLSVDDIDASPSGTAWLALSSHGDSATTAAVVRIDPDGTVRTAVTVSPDDPGRTERLRLQIAADDEDVRLGLRCGTVRVQTLGHELAMDDTLPACDGDARHAVALEFDHTGALWEVQADGRVRRTSGAGTTTLTRISRSNSWTDEGPDMAFRSVSGRVHAVIQRAHSVVEIDPHGRSVAHPLPRRVYYDEGDTVALGLTADATGALSLVTNRGVERLDLDRCGVRKVTGLPARAATKVLRDAGCRVHVHAVPDRGTGPARVVRQSMGDGASPPAGSMMVLDRARIDRRCAADPRRSAVLAHNRSWIIRRESRDGDLVTACDRGNGRRWTVDDASTKESSITKVRLRGSWLGLLSSYDTTGYSHEGGSYGTTLRVAGLRDQRRRRVVSFGGSDYYSDDGDGGSSSSAFGTPFTTWTLNARGDVAWLEERAVRLLRHGAKKPVTLDSDPTAVFAHLKVDGRRVSWTRDGVARSALI